MEKYCRGWQPTDDNIIRRMRIACWITTATDTHSEYVILIAFPLQPWLRERAPLLLYPHIVCLVTQAELKILLHIFLSLASVLSSFSSARVFNVFLYCI